MPVNQGINFMIKNRLAILWCFEESSIALFLIAENSKANQLKVFGTFHTCECGDYKRIENGFIIFFSRGISYTMILLCLVQLVKIFECICDFSRLLIRGQIKGPKSHQQFFGVLLEGLSYLIIFYLNFNELKHMNIFVFFHSL